MTMKNPEKKSSVNTLKSCVMYFLPCPPSWMCTDESELKKGHAILPPTPRCCLHHCCRWPPSSASSSQLLLALRLGLEHPVLLSWSISGRTIPPFPHLIISINHAAHSLATASAIHCMWSNTSVHPQENVQFDVTHRMLFVREQLGLPTNSLLVWVSPTESLFCLSVTHRKLFLLEVTHRKTYKLQSYPQKDVFDSMWLTHKRFASKLPTENRNFLSLPTKVVFFEKYPQKINKDLGLPICATTEIILRNKKRKFIPKHGTPNFWKL